MMRSNGGVLTADMYEFRNNNTSFRRSRSLQGVETKTLCPLSHVRKARRAVSKVCSKGDMVYLTGKLDGRE
jgi:hypothetical protein